MVEMINQMLEDGTWAVWLSALGALVSVLLVGLPMIRRQERSSHMRRVIDYRTTLLENEKKRLAKPVGDSNAQSVADLMRFRKQLSKHRGVQDRLMAAGLRKPRHVVAFVVARLALPVVFSLVVFIMTQAGSRPVSMATQMGMYSVAILFGYFLPGLWVKNIETKRDEAITEVFPDALDLMLVCVEGGLSIEQAILTITAEYGKSAPILAEEMGILSAELSFLGERAQALKNFANRVPNPSARSLVNAILQSERYGTPLAQALRTQAFELRDKRMSEAEKKAAALPPKLTVPMIAFFMPSLFVVILGPAVLQAMQAFSET